MRHLIFLLIVFIAIGCASTQEETYDEFSSMGEPSWVALGSGAFSAKEGRVFYGVGVASGMKNQALLTQTADEHARAEAARIVNAFADAVADDYLAVNSQADSESLSRNMKEVAKLYMTSVQVVRHWTNPVTGAVYSLARVYLFRFDEDLGGYKGLDGAAKKYIKQNTERLHEMSIRRPLVSNSQ